MSRVKTAIRTPWFWAIVGIAVLLLINSIKNPAYLALSVNPTTGLLTGNLLDNNDRDALLARLTPTGDPDPAFGSGGVVRLDTGADEEFSRVVAAAHGRVPQGRFAVIGYGSLGGEELGFGSDLDLVFLYDAPADAQSYGARPLEAGRDEGARLVDREADVGEGGYLGNIADEASVVRQFLADHLGDRRLRLALLEQFVADLLLDRSDLVGA